MAKNNKNCKRVVSRTIGGKRKYFYGHTKAEAQQKAAIAQALYDAGVEERKKNPITVKEVTRKYLDAQETKKKNQSKQYMRDCRSAAELYLIEDVGSMPVQDVRPSHLDAMLVHAADRVGPARVSAIMQITKQVFVYAVHENIIEISPAATLKAPECEKERGRHRSLTEYERTLFLKTAKKYPEESLYYQIMYYTGLRPQEVAALRYRDFLAAEKIIDVNKARKAGNAGVEKTKTKAGTRKVPVPAPLYDILKSLDRKPDDLIVTSRRGIMHTSNSERRSWRRFKALMSAEDGAPTGKYGVVLEDRIAEDLTPYCFRHTYATDLRDAGVDLDTRKRLLGHEKISTTSDIYTHESDQAIATAAAQIDAFYASRSQKNEKMVEKML